jgi:glycosyltransferase involved in cell wall biosynthesis
LFLPALPESLDREGKTEKVIVAMGRLDHQKGFDILLDAFSRVRDRCPEWRLHIFGEGPLRTELEELVDKLGLTASVRLPGWTQDPFSEFKHGDLFVLSSRFEGFPNVLCEAMACGMPVIATDCPRGPREIVRPGVDGLLVPPEDVHALALAMHRLMCDEVERRRLASRAAEVASRFAPDKVMGLWEELLSTVIEQSGS